MSLFPPSALRCRLQTLWNRPRHQTTSSSSSSSFSSTSASSSSKPSLLSRLGIAKAAQAYVRSQRKRPYTTHILSSLVIYAAADLAAQRIAREERDNSRVCRSMLIGAVGAAPSLAWIVWLSRAFRFPKSPALSVVARVVVHQIVFAPLFTGYFFAAHALLAGQGAEGAARQVVEQLPPAWARLCVLLPAVTVVNMSLVPLELRGLVTNLVALGWQTYLSWRNARLGDDGLGNAGLRGDDGLRGKAPGRQASKESRAVA